MLFFALVTATSCAASVTPGQADALIDEENPMYGVDQSDVGGARNTLARKYAWATSGRLTTGDPNKFVSIQADFSEEPQEYTASFNTDITLSAQPGIQILPPIVESLIIFTVEGVTSTRRINVVNGASITFTGQSFRILVQDNSFLGFHQAPYDYGVSCLVARGSRGTSMQPPTLQPQQKISAGPNSSYNSGVAVLAAGESVVVGIQPDAGAIAAFVTALPAPAAPHVGDIQIRAIYHNPASLGDLILRAWDPMVDTSWVPLPPGTNAIGMTNNSATIYEVYPQLGIEG